MRILLLEDERRTGAYLRKGLAENGFAVDVVPPEAEPLARITRRVKATFDPRGILNPGRLYAGL